MDRTFTKDDVGKPVQTLAGTLLGVVTAVDPGMAYVEPDPGMARSTRASLGWSHHTDAVPLTTDNVNQITDQLVLVESKSDIFPTTGGSETESDPPPRRDRSTTHSDDGVDTEPARREQPQMPAEERHPPGEHEPERGEEPLDPDDDFEALEGHGRREFDVDPTALDDSETESSAEEDTNE